LRPLTKIILGGRATPSPTVTGGYVPLDTFDVDLDNLPPLTFFFLGWALLVGGIVTILSGVILAISSKTALGTVPDSSAPRIDALHASSDLQNIGGRQSEAAEPG
jgi:hypothetical protein